MLYEVIIEICRWLLVGFIAITGVLAGSVFFRRVMLSRENAQRRDAEGFARQLVSDWAAGRKSAETLIARVKQSATPSFYIQKALLDCINDDNRSAISQLCNQLGYVSQWTSEATANDAAEGAPFEDRNVRQSAAVHNLGLLQLDLAVEGLAPALQTKSATVRLSLVRALVRSRSSAGLNMTIRELHRSIRGQSQVPARFVAGALAGYGLDRITQFADLLSNPNSKVRFHAVDVIRQICTREARSGNSPVLPMGIQTLFLNSLSVDSCDDVRARSAAVLEFISTPQAAHTLRTLLNDANKYVRMYACRAAIAHSNDLSDELAMLLSDDYWRVREAAAQTLARAGEHTRAALLDFLRTTRDPYGWDAAMEQLQRYVGVLPGSAVASLHRPEKVWTLQQLAHQTSSIVTDTAEQPSCPQLNFPVLAGEQLVEGAMLW